MRTYWRLSTAMVVAVLLAATTASAETLSVPHSYATIALALDHAEPGDIVLVFPGTYYESNLIIPAGVHLFGSGPDPELTVIDAQEHGRVLTTLGDGTLVLSLRLTGGWAVRGGGVHVDAGNNLFSNVVIDDCYAANGGGMFVTGGQVELQNCVLANNTAGSTGGGLQAMQADLVRLDGCLVHGNEAGAMGGAWQVGLSALEIESCTVEGNRAPRGAEGVAFGLTPVNVNHSISSDNRAGTGWADLQTTLLSDHASKLQNTCVLRWQYGDPVWSGYLADQLADAGLGNLDANPVFCRGDGDWEQYFGLAANSPALPVDGGCALRGAYSQACDPVGAPEVPALVDRLYPAFPNPFNPSTTIQYDVAQAGPVTLVIYSLDGRRVANLVNEEAAIGRHEATWLGRDDRGRSMASGVYLARLVTPAGPHAIRLTLVK